MSAEKTPLLNGSASRGSGGATYSSQSANVTIRSPEQTKKSTSYMYRQTEDRRRHDALINVSTRTLVIYVVITVIALAAVLTVCLYFGLSLKETEQSSGQHIPKLGVYRHAAVAADSYECSRVGSDILERGGSAVDSAIASLLCDGVQNMHSMGIGGGFFMTIYTRETQQALIIDARESAPLAADRDMYVNMSGASVKGGLAIAVPGEIRGYAEAHGRFGKLPWKELFEPTIRMCRDGFRISNALAKTIKVAGRDGGECSAHDTWNMGEILFRDQSKQELHQEGDVLKLPTLANTLERIANVGAEDLYTGELARTLVEDVRSVGGIITEDDLRNYTVKIKEPLHVLLDDYLIYSPPPPASGAVMQLILNILDGYDFSPMDVGNVSATALTYHRVIEAFKFAYAKRSELGDEDYVDVVGLVANLTSESYANWLKLKIWDNSTHNVSYYGPSFDLNNEEHGTAHISVLAENGDAVAVTSTINQYFGSCVRSARTGIILNDEMDDFSTPGTTNAFGIPASPSNYIVPGKRPMSSMSPSVLTDRHGDVLIVIGASGGSKITTTIAWVLVHDFWLGKKIDAAIDAPRLHHQLVPDYIQYETSFDKDILTALLSRGHAEGLVYDFSNACQGISVDYEGDPATKVIYAYSDQRKGGLPDGY